MPNFALLADELTVDPLSRGYAGMTDAEAQADISSFYRDGPADPGALFNYLAKETSREDAAEGVATAIFGRLHRVNELGSAAIGTAIFFTANMADEELDACRTILAIAQQDRLQSIAQVMTETKFETMLNHAKDCGVMKAADVTAIQALSQNKQRRDHEIGFGSATVAHITRVRAA